MRVSVVVPAYQQVDLIAQTLDSVLAQTYQDYELVVADHSSSDGTAEVLERYRDQPRVRLLDPTPRGGGAPANWNRVTEHARGDLIKLLPGDDLLDPTALEQQVAAFDAHPNAAMVCSRRRIIDATGKVLKASHGMPRSGWGAHDGRTMTAAAVRAGRNIFGEPGSVLLRRDLLSKAGGWDASKAYMIDMASYLNAMLHGHEQGFTEVVALPEVVSSFRVSAGQWSVALAGQQAAQAMALHHELDAAHPGLLSRRDLVQGDLTVRAMALVRQAVYLVLAAAKRD